MNKSHLRELILNKRKSLSQIEVAKRSLAIFNKLTYDAHFILSKNVFIYLSFSNEVETDNIITFSLKNNKGVFVPYIDENDNMQAVEFTNFDKLIFDKYGIRTVQNSLGFIDKHSIDLCIVPGIVFDKDNNRIGFGKGYYDKFLSGLSAKKIGICYDFQVVGNIENEQFDIKMDKLITDNLGEKI